MLPYACLCRKWYSRASARCSYRYTYTSKVLWQSIWTSTSNGYLGIAYWTPRDHRIAYSRFDTYGLYTFSYTWATCCRRYTFLIRDVSVEQKYHTIPTIWHTITLLPFRFNIFVSIMFIFDISVFNKLLLLARTHEIIVSSLSPLTAIVVLYSIFNVARTIGEFLIGFLSDYVSRILLLATLGCGTYTATLILMFAQRGSLWYCSLFFILFGISTAASTALKKACTADMIPAEIRGFGYGVLQVMEGIAALISSALIGCLWSAYSPAAGFVYALSLSSIALLCLLIFNVLFKKDQSKA